MKRDKSPIPLSTLLLLASLVLAVSTLAAGQNEEVLYAFHGGSDGNEPQASLVADKAGNLYGTTVIGGDGPNCSAGCGIVFKLSPSASPGVPWVETLLHSFQGGADGAYPSAPLIFDRAGNLYGTTSQGGNGNCNDVNMAGCGTVFELSPPAIGGSWTYNLLYNFQGVPSGFGNGDAADPNGMVFGKDGNLYGFGLSGGHCSTSETGTDCTRAAFKLKKSGGSWSETVIYRFPGAYSPYGARFFGADGNLYGDGPGGLYGFGAVFRLEPPKNGAGWTESGVYDFQGNGDGAFPLFGIGFDPAGNLYGASLGTGFGYSNVFEVSPTPSGEWTESVLYNFVKLPQGYDPTVSPILGKDGSLYGTTEGGGLKWGTVYELAPPSVHGGAWAESVLYSFAPGNDGFVPQSGLIFDRGGALYGTTSAGGDTTCGVNGNGCGTVFRVLP